MRRVVKVLIVLIFVFNSAKLFSQDPAQLIAEGDQLYKQGGELYCQVPNCLELWKQAIAKYKEATKVDPKNYDAWWKLSRAYRQYGDEIQARGILNNKPWKQETDKYAKLGMAAAEKAIKLNPNRVEGWLMFGLNVGLHSDAVSVFTALKEGLKGKTEEALGKAYKIDKDFDDGRPILAWGRFWTVLPWPLRKLDKGIKILREGIATHGNGKWGTGGTYTFQLFLAEALIKDGGSKNKAEAKKLLQEIVAKCPVKLTVYKAKKHLKELE